jgi:hypothetical protein
MCEYIAGSSKLSTFLICDLAAGLERVRAAGSRDVRVPRGSGRFSADRFDAHAAAETEHAV